MIDDETLSAGLGVAAYHLQVGLLAVLVGSKTITNEDAAYAIEYAEKAVRKPTGMPEGAKDAASAALALLLKSYRRRH
jgi:hypothetical protein